MPWLAVSRGPVAVHGLLLVLVDLRSQRIVALGVRGQIPVNVATPDARRRLRWDGLG